LAAVVKKARKTAKTTTKRRPTQKKVRRGPSEKREKMQTIVCERGKKMEKTRKTKKIPTKISFHED
jgi:phosphatidate phosphatase PAH1